MRYTTIGRPPVQSPNPFSCYPSHKQFFLSDAQELTSIGRLHAIDANSSVTRDGVISVTYKTHWPGPSEPACGREMDLQHSRNHILRYSASTPDQHSQINRLTAECASMWHSVSFLRTKANVFGAQLRSHHAHRVDSPPPRHSTPSGGPLLVQGRRRFVVAWANQR